NRCRRKDQGDWFTLYRLLEVPSIGVLDFAASTVYKARKALRLNDPQTLRTSLDKLSLALAPNLMDRFVKHLEESAPKLSQVRATPGDETAEPELATARVALSYE